VADQGGLIGESDPTAATLTATPRKLAALTSITNEAIDDSDPAVLEVFARQVVRAVGLKFDLGVYEGSGTEPEVMGMKNVAGISTVSMGTNDGTPQNLDPIADAIGALEGTKRDRHAPAHLEDALEAEGASDRLEQAAPAGLRHCRSSSQASSRSPRRRARRTPAPRSTSTNRSRSWR